MRIRVLGATALTVLFCAAGVLTGAGSADAAVRTFEVETTLDGRTVKDPDVAVGEHRVSDMYPADGTVDVVCQDTGPSYGGSTIWDLTTEGLWVADSYVETGSNGMVMARCELPKSFPAKVALNGRQDKGDPADAPDAVVDKYLAGDAVPIDCQAVADGKLWNHTTDGLWVPDRYVDTGTSGFVTGLPRCDTDGIHAAGSAVHGRNAGPAGPGPTTGTDAVRIERIVEAARSQRGLGLNYAWGAGGKGGPSYGIHHHPDGDPSKGDDYFRYGFDCSGLTLYAFWKGAGIDIGSWTGTQYRAGTPVALSERERGDLVFWGSDVDDPATTTHVAIYLGDDRILEAAPPRDGNSVHVAGLYSHGEPLSTVRRVIG